MHEMAESAFADDPKLSHLVEGVVIKAQTETKLEKSKMICDVVKNHIKAWLDQVEQIDPLYKVSELIPVGSYAEGTKILQADEFDYLAVIEGLSKPKVIIIDASEDDIKCGLVKVIITDEELKSKWSKLCVDGHLKCFQPINFPKKGEMGFGHVCNPIFKEDCFIEEDCAGPSFAKLVLSRKSLLLIGTSFESFKVTVTEAEVEYILTVMKPEHKMIYVFMKYIVNLYGKIGGFYLTFTSYMLKTVCIHHDIKCVKNNISIAECLKSLINDLNVCKQQRFVVSIMNKNIHLSQTYADFDYVKECLLQGMTTICQLPVDIETVEDFDTFMERIVSNERQKIEEAEKQKTKQILAEKKERVKDIVAMGFDIDEVKVVMEDTCYDSEEAISILRRRAARKCKKEKAKENV